MSFDIPVHIENGTPEAKVIEAIISRDHVTPEEAIRRLLHGAAVEAQFDRPTAEAGKTPGELLFGLFSDEPDLMKQIAEDSRKSRDGEVVKGYSA